MYIKYAASILVALLLCGVQHVVEAHRNRHDRRYQHAATTTYNPTDCLLAYTDNCEIFKMFSDYSTPAADTPQQLPAAENLSIPVLAFDAKESNTTYKILCDLPGIEKKDISLLIKQNELTISATRSNLAEEDGFTSRRTERPAGEFTRTIVLPDDCMKDKIAAETKDGVLVIIIPKQKQADLEEDVVRIEIN